MNAMDSLDSLFFLAWAAFFACLFIIGAALFVCLMILWDKRQEKYWRKTMNYSSHKKTRRGEVIDSDGSASLRSVGAGRRRSD